MLPAQVRRLFACVALSATSVWISTRSRPLKLWACLTAARVRKLSRSCFRSGYFLFRHGLHSFTASNGIITSSLVGVRGGQSRESWMCVLHGAGGVEWMIPGPKKIQSRESCVPASQLFARKKITAEFSSGPEFSLGPWRKGGPMSIIPRRGGGVVQCN